MNKKRSKEDWQQLVEEYKNSGLSLTNWCKEKTISKSTIYPYVKKYSKENVEITPHQWGSIDISDKTMESSISLKIGNITLEVKRGFEEETRKSQEAEITLLKNQIAWLMEHSIMFNYPQGKISFPLGYFFKNIKLALNFIVIYINYMCTIF